MDVETFLSVHTAPEEDAVDRTKQVLKSLPWDIADIVRVSKDHWKDYWLVPTRYFELQKTILTWCSQHCEGNYGSVRGFYYFAFELESDAIVFKLRWG